MARRSKFAIDFNQNINKVAELVLADLVRKYPRGANGKLSSKDYAYYHKNPLKCFKESASRENVGIWCGYTTQQIVSLFLGEDAPFSRYRGLRDAIEKSWYRERHPHKSDEEVASSYYYAPEATVTRRMNRINERVDAVKRHIREAGMPGVYRFNTGYQTAFRNVNFYVWAKNKSDACGQFNTLTRPLIAAADPGFSIDDHVECKQSFEHINEPENAMSSYNQLTIEGMNDLENDLQRRIQNLEKELEGLRGIKGMITEMAINSITQG